MATATEQDKPGAPPPEVAKELTFVKANLSAMRDQLAPLIACFPPHVVYEMRQTSDRIAALQTLQKIRLLVKNGAMVWHDASVYGHRCKNSEPNNKLLGILWNLNILILPQFIEIILNYKNLLIRGLLL